MIEEYKPYIENLLKIEPWRRGESSDKELCTGHVDYDGSHFWVCKSCGRIGTSTSPLHLPVRHPGRALIDFFKKVSETLAKSKA